MDASLFLLFGRARTLVLAALHRAGRDELPLHLRELARRTELSPTAVQYELRVLRQAGIVEDVGTASRPLYVVNRAHPHFAEMQSMFLRTADTAPATDDAHFNRKRVRQAKDALAARPEQNSPFLREGASLRRNVKLS